MPIFCPQTTEVEPMTRARNEGDHRETRGDAAESRRAAMLPRDARGRDARERDVTDKLPVQPTDTGGQGSVLNHPAPRVGGYLLEESGIPDMTVDGRLQGDCRSRAHAPAAATLAEFSPQ